MFIILASKQEFSVITIEKGVGRMYFRLLVILLTALLAMVAPGACILEGIARDGIEKICFNYSAAHRMPADVDSASNVTVSIQTKDWAKVEVEEGFNLHKFNFTGTDEFGNKVRAEFRWDSATNTLWFRTSWPSECTAIYVPSKKLNDPKFFGESPIILKTHIYNYPGDYYNHTLFIPWNYGIESLCIKCESRMDELEEEIREKEKSKILNEVLREGHFY